MVVFENECKKTNTRSQTQKYLSLGKFTLAPLCEPHKIEIVQEKRQVTFIAIVRWGDTDAVGMRILAAKKLNVNNPA